MYVNNALFFSHPIAPLIKFIQHAVHYDAQCDPCPLNSYKDVTGNTCTGGGLNCPDVQDDLSTHDKVRSPNNDLLNNDPVADALGISQCVSCKKFMTNI